MSKENRVKIAERTNNPVLKFFSENLGIIAALIVISVIVAIMSPVFLSVDNALSVGRQISTNAVLTLGMGMVIITGGIDLSVGAVVALTGTLCVGFINQGIPVPVSVILCVGIGVLVGFLNGIIIAKTGMAPFIVTMSTMNIGRGIAYLYSGGLPLRCTRDDFAVLGTGDSGPVPLPIIYLIILILIRMAALIKSKIWYLCIRSGRKPGGCKVFWNPDGKD
ncbi:MAG: ABC transporter permease [Muricomes sp.]